MVNLCQKKENTFINRIHIKENSKIQFAYFPEQVTYSIKPEEGDILIFDSDLYHRVVDSKKERISLAFNFQY